MKPWLAAVTLGVMPIMQAGFDPKSGVEYTLKPEFDKANKPVKGFETAEQQLHLFADMSDKTQVDYLASELDDYESSLSNFRKLIDAWYAGDDATMDKILSAELRDKYPTSTRRSSSIATRDSHRRSKPCSRVMARSS